MKTAKEFIDEVFHTQKMMPYTEKCVTEIIHKFAAQQVVLERERIKKLFDTKLLPIDPIPMNILKIAKAVSEIYDKIKL